MGEMIQIDRQEYEALVAALAEAREDLADIEAYDQAVTRAEEAIPDAFVGRILDGETPLRVLRDWRGLTQAALAEASGVNRVQIANIESGRRSGSVETLKRLAGALGLGVDDLI